MATRNRRWVQGALLLFAINDPSFAVEPDYERKALNWDDAQRERAASRSLGWTTELSTRPASTPGEVEVGLDLFDRHGKRVHDVPRRPLGRHAARPAARRRSRATAACTRPSNSPKRATRPSSTYCFPKKKSARFFSNLIQLTDTHVHTGGAVTAS